MHAKNQHTVQDDEFSLLLQVAKGNETAFTQLVAKYRNQVFGHALMFVKSPEIAEEMAQDIFVKIWFGREKLTTVDSFSNYLFILSRNHLVSYLRKPTIEITAMDNWAITSEDSKSPEKQLHYKQLQEQIEKGITKLKPQQQLAYQYCKEQGFTYKEAAEQMQVSPETVKWHLVAALNFLRGYMRNNLLNWLLMPLLFCEWLKK